MDGRQRVSHLARRVLAAFVLTFVGARVLVLLIMTHHIPDLFVHVGGTHVHHLNFGIFLLSGVGAYLLFARPIGVAETISALVYGVGLGLTFDEFGMWLHLGGAYWQRASFDAVVVIAGLLGLISVAPSFSKFEPKHWIAFVMILVMTGVFFVLSKDSFGVAGKKIKQRLEQVEAGSPQ